jgi:hypothetical protein
MKLGLSMRHLSSTAALFMAVLVLVAPHVRQEGSKAPPNSPTEAVVYFTPGAIGWHTNLFSQVLSQFNEPSLLAAAQDSSALSYRFESMAGQKWQFLVVRVSISSDGSARVFAVELSGTPPILHRTEHSASAADVKKFLQLVDRADFWSMRATESGQGYYRDSGSLVFEGVRNGTYHVVVRDGGQGRPFVDMMHFLAVELAKLGESDIPH